MASYKSSHKGSQIDNAVSIANGNLGKGSSELPIYYDANGVGQVITVDDTATNDSNNLLKSSGAFSGLGAKLNKSDIQTNTSLGNSDLPSSQNAVKVYTNTILNSKRDQLQSGYGVSVNGPEIAVNEDVIREGDERISLKVEHFQPYEVGNELEMLETLREASHSTFVGWQSSNGTDTKKFKKLVASGYDVNITSGGIASGFSTGAKLVTPISIKVSNNDSIVFRNRVMLKSDVSSQETFLNCNDWDGVCIYTNSYKITFSISRESIYTDNELDQDVWYDYECSYSNNVLTLKYRKEGEESWISKSRPFTKTFDLNYVYNIGRFNWSYPFIHGLMDLKYFEIVVNDVPVFLGSKTGLDIIKPDDYGVVGSPLVSDDGIASGFSSNDYIESTSMCLSNSDFEVIQEISVKGLSTAGYCLKFVNSTSSFCGGFYLNADGTLTCSLKGVTGDIIASTTSSYALSLYNSYLIRAQKDGSEYSMAVKEVNSSTWTQIATSSSTDLILNNSFFVAQINPDGCDVTSDLNDFKIFVNGDVNYQPMLRIPFILTKEGKKVVSSGYRNRVKDEYDQFRYTPYYTLSSTDYTLATINLDDIVDSYENGIMTYVQRANLSLEQTGTATSSVPVTFPKPFMDTDYAISLPYSVKTKTGFTPSISGDYIAEGYIGPEIRWQDIILSGNTALTLVNAKADGLNYLKLFGDTELLPETYLDTVTLSGGCRQSNLPEGYTQVNGVTGDDNNYINLNTTLTQDDEIEFVFSYSTNYITQEQIFGARTNASENNITVFFSSTGNRIVIDFNNSNYADYRFLADLTPNTIYKVLISKNRRAIYQGDTLVAENTTVCNDTIMITNPYLYYASNNPAYLAKFTGTIYSLKINGKRIMTSCKQSTSAGFYDSVSGSMFALTNGIAGSDVTPSPTTPIDIVCNNGAIRVDSQGNIYTDGTQEVVTDSLGNTANAVRLLGIGDYKDTQEVLSGSVTKRIGITVLDGTEIWNKSSTYTGSFYTNSYHPSNGEKVDGVFAIYCTHGFKVDNLAQYSSAATGAIYWYAKATINYKYDNGTATVEQFKQWLADQYANGTPVTIAYPLATATTESATPQLLAKSPVTQTAGSISGLPIAITESSHTEPTPQQPLQINCNNGVVKVSKNLVNTANSTKGQYITYEGIIQSSTNWATSDYLPVIAGGKVTVSGLTYASSAAGFNFYNASKNKVSTILYETGTHTYTVPNDASYIMITYRWSNDESTVKVYVGETLNAPYVDGTTETVEIIGKNLYNVATRIEGYYISSGGVPTAESGSYYSALILVQPNTTYVYSGNSGGGNKRLHAYDKDGNWIEQINVTTFGTPFAVSGTTPANCKYVRISGAKADTDVQVEQGSTATTYEAYFNGGTATAQPLYKVDTYQDVQEVLDGEVTRNIGIKVLDGTEDWTIAAGHNSIVYCTLSGGLTGDSSLRVALPCTHLIGTDATNVNMPQYSIKLSVTQAEPTVSKLWAKLDGNAINLTAFKQWLAQQYANGNPVIVVYPLSTATTETVTPQPLTIQAGTNIVQITQASMDGLELEVSYKKTT